MSARLSKESSDIAKIVASPPRDPAEVRRTKCRQRAHWKRIVATAQRRGLGRGWCAHVFAQRHGFIPLDLYRRTFRPDLLKAPRPRPGSFEFHIARRREEYRKAVAFWNWLVTSRYADDLGPGGCFLRFEEHFGYKPWARYRETFGVLREVSR